MARGLFAVMEDELSDDVAATDVAPEQVEQLEAQVAEGELNQAETEVSEASEVVDQATAAIEELAEIQEVMADSVVGDGTPEAPTGDGLSEDAAKVAEVAVESICARLGYKPAKKIVPALESFGSSSSRLEATRYAMETIGGTISRIWQAIKDFFKNIWNKLKEFWARLFDGATKLKNRAIKVQEKVTNAVDKNHVVNTDKKINASKYCAAFEVTDGNKALDAAEEILKRHSENIGVIKTAASDFTKSLDTLAKVDSVNGINKVMKKISGNQEKIGSQFPVVREEGDTTYFGGIGFGHRVKTVLTNDGNDMEISLISTDIKDSKSEITATNPKNLKDIVATTKKFAEDLLAYRAIENKTDEFLKKGIELADQLSKEEASAEKAKTQAAGFRYLQSLQRLTSVQLPKIGISVGNMALNLVEANLDGLKAA